VISNWQGKRRIGSPPLIERLEIYWKLPLIAFVTASLFAPVLLVIASGWPPSASPRGLFFVWCVVFTLMMVVLGESVLRNGLWREVAWLVVIAVTIAVAVWTLSIPLAEAVGLFPSIATVQVNT